MYAADVRAIIRRDKLLLFQNKQKEEDDKEDKEERAHVKVQDEKHTSSEPSEAKQEPDLSEQVMKEMRRISLQGRQTFGDGVAEENPFEFMWVTKLFLQGSPYFRQTDPCCPVPVRWKLCWPRLLKDSSRLQIVYRSVMLI